MGFRENAVRSEQQPENPPRSHYTVPYVLWLANADGDSMLLKPKQLHELNSACRGQAAPPKTARTTLAPFSAGTTRKTSSTSALTPAAAENAEELPPLALLSKLKRPAAAVCLLGAVPKDLETSAVLPAELSFRSEESTEKIKAALRHCTEAYWQLLRTCQRKFQQGQYSKTHRPEQFQQHIRSKCPQHYDAAAQQPRILQPQRFDHAGNKDTVSDLQQPPQLLRSSHTCAKQQQQLLHEANAQHNHHETSIIVTEQAKKHLQGATGVSPGDLREGNMKQLQQHRQRVHKPWSGKHFKAASSFRTQHPNDSSDDSDKQNVHASCLPRPLGVLLSHLGFEEEARIAADIGGALGGLDFIFSGHSHTDLPSHMFPAFVRQVKPGGREAAFSQSSAAQSITGKVATSLPNSNHSVSSKVSNFPRSLFSNIETLSENETADAAECSGEADQQRRKSYSDQAGAKKSERRPDEAKGVDGVKLQIGFSRLMQAARAHPEKKRRTQRQPTRYVEKWNSQYINILDRKRFLRSKENKHPKTDKKNCLSHTWQYSAEARHLAYLAGGIPRKSVKKGSGNRYSRRRGNANGNAGERSNSALPEVNSTQQRHPPWQSGAFIITSASHGKRISFADIYFLVFDEGRAAEKGGENGDRASTHFRGDAKQKAQHARGQQGQRKGKEGQKPRGKRKGENEGQEMRGGRLEEMSRESEEILGDAGLKRECECPLYRDRGVLWLQGEQLPPVFSTVDVNDFAEWAATAILLPRKAAAEHGTRAGGRTQQRAPRAAIISQQVAEQTGALQFLPSEAVFPHAAAERASPEDVVTNTTTGTGRSIRSQGRLPVHGSGSPASSRHTFLLDDTKQLPSEQGSRQSSGSQQNHISCNSCGCSTTEHGASGSHIELHSAEAYQYLCIMGTQADLSSTQWQRNHRTLDKSTPTLTRPFVDTHASGGRRFDSEAATPNIKHCRAPASKHVNERSLGELLSTKTKATDKVSASTSGGAQGTRRRDKVVTTDVKMPKSAAAMVHLYAACSFTAQPVPPLLWPAAYFSVSSYDHARMPHLVKLDRRSVTPATTVAESRPSSVSPFVACVFPQPFAEAPSYYETTYRLPYFGWLPSYLERTAYSAYHSDQRHEISQSHKPKSCGAHADHLRTHEAPYQQSQSLHQSPHNGHQSSQQQQQQARLSFKPRLRKCPTATMELRNQRMGQGRRQPCHRAPTHQTEPPMELHNQRMGQGRRQPCHQAPPHHAEPPCLYSPDPSASRTLCYRLSSALPLFPVVSPPAWPSPPLAPTGRIEPLQGGKTAASDIVAGVAVADGGVYGGSAGVVDAAMSASEAGEKVHQYLCRAPVNASLVCPFSKTIQRLRCKRLANLRPLGTTAAAGVDGSFDSCRRSECAMGRLISDALRYAALKAILWQPAGGSGNTGAEVAARAAGPTGPTTVEAAPARTRPAAPLSTVDVPEATDTRASKRSPVAATTAAVASAVRAVTAERWEKIFKTNHRWRRTRGCAAAPYKKATGAYKVDHMISSLHVDPLVITKEVPCTYLLPAHEEKSGTQKETLRTRACESSSRTEKSTRNERDGPIMNTRRRKKGSFRIAEEEKSELPLMNVAGMESSKTADVRRTKAVRAPAEDNCVVQDDGTVDSTAPRQAEESFSKVEPPKNGAPSEQKKSGRLPCAENVTPARTHAVIPKGQSDSRCASKTNSLLRKDAHMQSGQKHSAKQRLNKREQQSDEKGRHSRRQHEGTPAQQRRLHQQAAKQNTQSRRMFLGQGTQDDVEKQQKCTNPGIAARSFLGIVAMQTSGDVRASFCPNCTLTDAEVENVLPWSSPLHVVTLSIQDFFSLAVRSIQNLVSSGSCVMKTQEALRIFPHISTCTDLHKSQNHAEPIAASSLPASHSSCHSSTTSKTHRITGTRMCVDKCRRFQPYTRPRLWRKTRWIPGDCACSCITCSSSIAAAQHNSISTTSNTCEYSGSCVCPDRISWCRKMKADGKQMEPCTILPSCAENAREDALESPSILQMSGARVEVRILQLCCDEVARTMDRRERKEVFHQVSECKSAAAFQTDKAREMAKQETYSYSYAPVLRRKLEMNSSTFPGLNKSAAAASSSSLRNISQYSSSCRTSKAMSEPLEASSCTSLQSSIISMYIPLHPLSLLLKSVQPGRSGFHYLFEETEPRTAGLLHILQEEATNPAGEERHSRQEEEEPPYTIWVKVETRQLLQVGKSRDVKVRRGLRSSTARGEEKDRLAILQKEDAAARRDNSYNFVAPDRVNCHPEADLEKKETLRMDSKQKWITIGNVERVPDISVIGRSGRNGVGNGQPASSTRHRAEEQEKKKETLPVRGKRRKQKVSGEKRGRGQEVEACPAGTLLANVRSLPVYILFRSPLQQPLLLQKLERLLRPYVDGVAGESWVLAPCGNTRNSDSSCALTQRATETQLPHSQDDRTAGEIDLRPICWVQQQQTPTRAAAQQGGKGKKYPKLHRNEHCTAGSCRTASGVSSEGRSSSEASYMAQQRSTETLPVEQLCVKFGNGSELLHEASNKQETLQEKAGVRPSHEEESDRHTCHVGSGSKTNAVPPNSRRTLEATCGQQATGALPSASTQVQPPKRTAVPWKVRRERRVSQKEKSAVIPLEDINLLGVVDQFFLHGGDKLLLNDAKYTFNVKEVPALEASPLDSRTAEGQADTREGDQMQRQAEGSKEQLQQMQEQRQQQASQHGHPRPEQIDQMPLGVEGGCLAVDALFNTKTARVALAEFLRLKQSRGERVDSSRFQRLVIQLER